MWYIYDTVKIKKVTFLQRHKITSLKMRQQNGITKIFHFQAPPLVKSWLRSCLYHTVEHSITVPESTLFQRNSVHKQAVPTLHY